MKNSQKNRIKLLENKLKKMIILNEEEATAPGTVPSPKNQDWAKELIDKYETNKRRKRKEDLAPWFTSETGVNPDSVNSITRKIAKIRAELKSYEGTEIEGSPRAKELKSELDSLTGSNLWTKTKFFCKKHPVACGIIGISAAALAYFGIKKAGQAMGVLPAPEPSPTPTPTPSPTPSGGGGGSRSVCHSGRTPKECTNLSWGCGGPSGPTSDKVKQVQQKLIDCGYMLPKFGVDGLYCTETTTATKKFQADVGFPVNGVADQRTVDALNKCKSKTPEEPSVEPVQKEPEKKPLVFKDFGASANESLMRRRNEQLENLVFERLVKNAN